MDKAEKCEASPFENDTAAPWKIIVADDDSEVHAVTKLALDDFVYEERSLLFLDAFSGEEVKTLMQEHPDTALILLDVVMESDNSGLEVVKYIRETLKNRFVRIVLRTGQPGQAPEMSVIREYDINDYKEKVELTDQKLFTSIVSSLRSYQDILVIESQRKALSKSLSEKEILLKEVHHRVKNNLQIISSLLSMQAGEVADPSALAKFKDSKDRVRSMALIHETLYQSRNFAEVNFKGYIDSLVKELIGSYDTSMNLRVDIQTDIVYLSVDRAIPLGLVVNELLTNAIKYAFPNNEGGLISVHMNSYKDDQVVLVVKDDGIGIDTTINLGHSKTLGLKLVSALTAQVEGQVNMTNNNGTCFTITFQGNR